MGCEATFPRKEMDTHMETGLKEHLQLMKRYAEELKCDKKLTETSEKLMTSRAFEYSRELGKARALLKRNCVYTESVTNRCYRTGVFYPLYGPGYRMQLWFYTSNDHIGVTVHVLGGHDNYRFM